MHAGNNRWKQSVELCKKDALYADAMEYASESRQPEVAEELLNWFLERDNFECFSACLYQVFSMFDIEKRAFYRHMLTDIIIFIIIIIKAIVVKQIWMFFF